MLRPILLVAFGLALGLGFTACDEERVAPADDPLPLSAWLPLRVGEQALEAQIALTPAEQSRGLMHREELGADQGMLFPYSSPRAMNFWMKNTLIPLDIGFFDRAGVLREVHPLYPRDTRSVRSRGDELHYALEMNQGWFEQHGVKPGARLDRDLLAAALAARGEDPARYGLDRE